VNSDDVRVCHGGSRARLTQESGSSAIVMGQRRRQHFDCHDAIEPGIARLENDAHRSPRDFLDHFVDPEQTKEVGVSGGLQKSKLGLPHAGAVEYFGRWLGPELLNELLQSRLNRESVRRRLGGRSYPGRIAGQPFKFLPAIGAGIQMLNQGRVLRRLVEDQLLQLLCAWAASGHKIVAWQD
jgi:hypothetical protein